MRASAWLWAGLALITLSVLWHFGVSPYWDERFPEGWGQEFNFIGISTAPDLSTDQFPPLDDTAVYQRVFAIIDRQPHALMMEDHYVIRDELTDAITYDYILRAEIDPRTAQHLNPEYQGDYYLFPRQVQKTTYRLRQSFIKGIPLVFQAVEMIGDLEAYRFSYHGAAEYTESYIGLTDARGRQVEAGQEIRCADDQFRLTLWVEPVTGEILKIDESCYSGDYIYDVATGEQRIPVLRWGAVTAGDDVQLRSDAVRLQKTRLLWVTRAIPLLFLAAGVVCLARCAELRFAPLRLVQRRSRHAYSE